MRVIVVEPDAHGRTSGGYLYNRRFSEHGAFELVPVAPSEPLPPDVLKARANDVVLADSLFLEPRRLAPFLALRERGVRVGALLHAFPSFIRRAADRATLERELPLVPNASELDLVARLDLVVAPGAYVARLLEAAGSRVPCIVCPPGADPRLHTGSKTPSTSVRLLMIANLTPAKGARDAIEALAPLRASPWRLTLVGALDADVSHVAHLRELVEQQGLTGRVHFRGALPHAETLAELDESDALVIASHTENCPLVALEAARAGVPVIGYAVGGLPELVRQGKSGCLVRLLDVAALTEALRELIVSPKERARLASGAVALGASLPTWRDAAAGFQRALLPYET